MEIIKLIVNAFDRSLANKQELDRPSSHFLNNRHSPEKLV
jgi:hypothetical protein